MPEVENDQIEAIKRRIEAMPHQERHSADMMRASMLFSMVILSVLQDAGMIVPGAMPRLIDDVRSKYPKSFGGDDVDRCVKWMLEVLTTPSLLADS
jgi:hypothetical protein